MRLKSTVCATAIALALPLATLSALTPQATAAPKTQRYIVMMAAAPAAVAENLPQANGGVDMRAPSVDSYRDGLERSHDRALVSIGAKAGAKIVDYTTAFNGFAAHLSEDQARVMGKAPGVVHVWEDEIRHSTTTGTPDFLKLTGSTGVWTSQFGGKSKAGRGMIIGVIDSGIWPESASFASLSEPRPDQAIIDAKWNGTCEAGVEEPVICNNKLIGARYFSAGATIIDEEFVSPRDWDGHGTHTASTAAGNAGVLAEINGVPLGRASGMAPQARIAAYKVLWETADHSTANGSTMDIVSAIDAAVADGVDVINYSISGSTNFVVSPDELAFMNAAEAGVFVSASAGNSGDTGPSTVAHNSPWVTTVAASTYDRSVAKTLTLGDGTTYAGVGVGPALGSAPMVISQNIPAAGQTVENARLCAPGALDAAAAAGKLVVCDRGVIDRVAKSAAVAEAGGVGMVLVNTAAGLSLNADFHSVPTIHVDSVSGAAIKAYVGGAAPTGAISVVSLDPAVAPEMATFSAYGPAVAGEGDLLKPDITAPGVDVIAAVAPPGNDGNSFNAYSGTSMSAPHIAGIAALIMQKKPTWTPMMVKSAMMTTATNLNNQGTKIQRAGSNATPFNYGSGHVRVGKGFNPGLVYKSGLSQWLGYACGIGQYQLLLVDPSDCDAISIDPSNLNTPSVAIGALAGKQTVTRKVRNVYKKASTYKASVKAPAGTTVVVSPAKFTIKPGKSVTLTIKIKRTTAAAGSYNFGSYTLKDQYSHVVKSPIAVRPVAISAAQDVALTGAPGTQSVQGVSGYAGTLNANVAGLVGAEVTPVTVPLDDANDDGLVSLGVSAGTKVLRVSTYGADYEAGVDVDLFLYNSSFELLGESVNGTSDESITIEGADLGGEYYAFVDYWAGVDPSLVVSLNSFKLDAIDAGNLSATPASQAVTTGGPFSFTLEWPTMEAGHYLGSVTYNDGTTDVGRSLVDLTVPAP